MTWLSQQENENSEAINQSMESQEESVNWQNLNPAPPNGAFYCLIMQLITLFIYYIKACSLTVYRTLAGTSEALGFYPH